jgi:hemolysin D
MASLLFARHRPRDRTALSLRNFESATAEVIAQSEPRVRRLTLYVLGAMIAVAIFLISVVQLDRVVAAQGRLVPIDGTMFVQPLDRGIIGNVRVNVGDIVKKGQVLATLDPTFTAADFLQLEQKVASLSAQQRRIEAEEVGGTFEPADAGPYDTLQLRIFRQRQQEFQSEINDFDARISRDEADSSGAGHDADGYAQRLKYASEIEKMRQALEKKGEESQLVLLSASDQRVEIARNLAQSQSKLKSIRFDLDALKAQRRTFIQSWHEKNLNELVDANNKLDAARQDLAKARRMKDLANLEAPADAVVVKIDEKASPGAVMTQAEPVFTLVPLDAPLEAEVHIDAKDIGFVHVGDPVKIKFAAYRFLEHGTGEGVIKTISQDSFTEDRDRPVDVPFYRAFISVTAVHLHNVPPNFHLIPGMTLDADVVVGRRTIAWYLIGGALRSGAEAMREP